MTLKVYLITLLSILSISVSFGQRENYSHSSSWNTFTVKADISENLSFKNEFNFRRTNFLKDWEQIVLRPAVQYKIDKRLAVSAGYSYIQNYKYAVFSSPIDFKENNIWQQLLIKQNFASFDLSHRIRFEERFRLTIGLVDQNTIITGTDYSGRLRYRFIINVPVLKKQDISLLLYDEVFLDFEQQLQPVELDQNWMFIGFQFRESEHITIKSGYHNINIPRTGKTITNHVWETTLIYDL